MDKDSENEKRLDYPPSSSSECSSNDIVTVKQKNYNIPTDNSDDNSELIVNFSSKTLSSSPFCLV